MFWLGAGGGSGDVVISTVQSTYLVCLLCHSTCFGLVVVVVVVS